METMKNYYNEKDGTFKYEVNSKEFWENILQFKKNKTILTGHVIALNYNGIIVNFNDSRMFMPSNNISNKKLKSFEQFLDKDIDFIVTEFDPLKNSIIISHKEILLEQKKKKIEEEKKSIIVGHIYDGIVKNILDFGAFIKLTENVTGLLHISQISHTKVKNIHSVLTKNQKVRVKVINNDDGKISLSMKALEKPEHLDNKEEINIDYKNIDLPKGEASTSLADLLENLDI